MLASPWSAASPYFSDCSQKHIFSMVLFSHFGETGERHGFIRRVCSSSVNAQIGLYNLCSLAWPEALRAENTRAACCWTGICKSSLKFLRDSSPETNTGPYLVCEKFEFGIFHCPCSLLGVSDGRVISSEYWTQTVWFCSYQPHVLLTLLNWSVDANAKTSWAKNNRPLQGELESWWSWLENNFQIWKAPWEAS